VKTPEDAVRTAQEAVERTRLEYARASLDVDDVDPDPVRQLERWLAAAVAAGIPEPNAMTLATVDATGRPDARVVLLRGLRDGRLIWFTDRTSTKGQQLAAVPHAALVFHWQELERQVRLRGPVAALDDAASDAYFATRPRASRLSAWASAQSRPVASRSDYEAQVAAVEARFAAVDDVPRPPSWGGDALTPDEVELWQGRRSRRHDRLRYRRAADAPQGPWRLERLQP